LEEFGFPRKISVTPSSEASNRKVSIDAHTPDVVGDSSREPLDASDIITPLLEALPIRPGGWRAFYIFHYASLKANVLSFRVSAK
jgi:hypothetical protein